MLPRFLLNPLPSYCFLLIFLSMGCQSQKYFEGGNSMIRTELFFGLSKPDGSAITSVEWEGFVDEFVTPIFPQGLSIDDIDGQWRMETGEIVKEDSKSILILHDSSPEMNRAINKIIEGYKERFEQEAVMRISTRVFVGF